MGNESASGTPAPAREVIVLASVYGLETVKKAAYRFIDRASPSFAVNADKIVCTFSFSRGVSEASVDAFVRDFNVELLDQDLRERIAKETAPLRNTILALAFAPTKPAERE